MVTPLSTITDFCRAEREADARRAAALQFAGAFERLYAQVGSHVSEMAALCDAHGKAALLAELPAEVGASINAALTLVEQVWPLLSDQPFPEMPDQPDSEAAQ